MSAPANDRRRTRRPAGGPDRAKGAPGTRRRIRPGLLSCCVCDRDLPEEEFDVDCHRRRADRADVPRSSWCRRCRAAYDREEAHRRYHADPAYREDQLRRKRERYRAKTGRELKADRRWRTEQALRALDRLTAAGWDAARIAAAVGVHRDTARKWLARKKRPRTANARALRKLAEGVAG